VYSVHRRKKAPNHQQKLKNHTKSGTRLFLFNGHFGKRSPPWAYFPDLNPQELSKSALFIKKGVLSFSIPLIFARFGW
jgi:hypothetical protein